MIVEMMCRLLGVCYVSEGEGTHAGFDILETRSAYYNAAARLKSLMGRRV